jgi:glycine betaine/choline ABC-type transport system substrate-binding protein
VRLPWIAVALSCACSSPAPALVVGAEEGPLGELSGELLAQALEAKGVSVTRRFDLGGARAVHEALRAGEVDLAVQRTGAALFDVLEQPIERDPERVFAAVEAGYRPFGLVWLPRLGWNDPWVVVLRPGVSPAGSVTRLEQLGPHTRNLRIAASSDFLERRDGLVGLSSHYGLGFAARVTTSADRVADALKSGRADIGVLRSLDPRIEKDALVVLADGLGWFPPYEGAPVVRKAALARFPKARAALEALGGRLSTEAMRAAVARIANEGAACAAQARGLLL